MLRRLGALFGRYRQAHRQIDAPGFPPGLPLHDPQGGEIGYIDRVRLQGDRVVFEGWCMADRVVLHNRDGAATQTPRLMRQDVAAARSCSPYVGFRISRPVGDARFTIAPEIGGQSVPHHLAPFPRALIRAHTLRLAARFALQLLRLSPAIAAWGLWRSPAAKQRIKHGLALRHTPESGSLASDLFAVEGAGFPLPEPAPVTIVLPVYNAFDLLEEVLHRVETHTDLPWHLVLIEDGSSDARVRPWLADWAAERAGGVRTGAAPGTVELLENPTNLGFIASVNRGLERARERGHHVVLLNSDAFVPEGWASRLLRPVLVHEDVASVTPLSNDAEIFSVPAICTRTPLLPGQAEALDATARRFHPEASLAEAPTGVGFCMGINIRFLQKIPALDTVFGRGYGEEVDWCQKVRALGGRHLGVANLFVEHRGGESFGAAKQALVAANNEIISTRYPLYDAEVQQFIQADPMVSARLALALAWAGSCAAASGEDRAVPVYLAHAIGGGADLYLEERMARDLRDTGLPSVVLRVGGARRWQIEVRSDQGRCNGSTDDFALVERLLGLLPRRHIVYSCGVGDPDPARLPARLLDLRQAAAGDSLEVLVHDFFMISPGYTLLDSTHRFRPPQELDPDDPAHILRNRDGSELRLDQWQAAWAPLMQAADAIVVFSRDSARHIRTAYPEAADRLTLRPHALRSAVPRLPAPPGPGRVIAVLGNIGLHKGIEVVAELARRTAAQPDLSVVVIGQTDPAYTLPAALRVHGAYDMADLPRIAARYGISAWLIPSIWPETFSYATHEALATGLPTYAFDLGAQGEAVAAAPNGHVIPFNPGRGPEGAWVEDILDTLNRTRSSAA